MLLASKYLMSNFKITFLCLNVQSKHHNNTSDLREIGQSKKHWKKYHLTFSFVWLNENQHLA